MKDIKETKDIKEMKDIKEKKFNINEMVTCALFGAATCILAPISIPLPFSPVPITLAVFITLLSGTFLSPKMAFTSQMIRILAGIIGLPVFANFGAGLGFIVGPLGGYLVVTPLMSMIVAYAASYCHTKECNGKKKFVIINASMVSAVMLCYLTGTIWLKVVSGLTFIEALFMGVIPFIPLDLLKIAVVYSVYVLVYKRLNHVINYS